MADNHYHPSTLPTEMIPVSGPFVLLDDASGGGPARLYTQPENIICAEAREELDNALAAIDTARCGNSGRPPRHVAGYFGYEAGLALEPKLRPRLDAFLSRKSRDMTPLCWFGEFADYAILPADNIDDWLAAQQGPHNGPADMGAFATQQSLSAYDDQFADIIEAIRRGDIYQANLTIRTHAHFDSCPIALYRTLRRFGAARYSALVYDGTHWLLSLSPELFFACHKGRITTRPMKGTLRANPDHAGDAAAAREYFARDDKNRAENLMIVDLLRNDLSRICEAGSVVTRDLFAVEHYPTVHQMVSTISGQMQSDIGAQDVIRALFPCGSITGAPKIRAMELIDDIEATPRGVYCGAIGRFDAVDLDKAANESALSGAFNVAIRTLHFAPQSQRLTLGLGSGIVADSKAGPEWRECLDKGAFAMTTARKVDLIETMALYPDKGILRLEAHLARMKASAQQLAYQFDRHAARNAIQAACFHAISPAKIRLLVSRDGNFAIQSMPLQPFDKTPIPVLMADMPVASNDPRLAHKTTDRAFYDDSRRCAMKDSEAAEVIFFDAAGFACEGSFTHIFVRQTDAPEKGPQYLTPPISRGMLPGILRQEMLDDNSAVEQDLDKQDIAVASVDGRLFLGNSVRGLFAVTLINRH
ncbi:aminodeoxychorismate synthase component I [Parasphingorhabdus sp. DH2-15]|uniref:aminodeoxychorismate synthase component I n=1 Tax=Parasphingorhabdus sp. DH2-15 TaxID=3444112 RepID=UPI003F6877EE